MAHLICVLTRGNVADLDDMMKTLVFTDAIRECTVVSSTITVTQTREREQIYRVFNLEDLPKPRIFRVNADVTTESLISALKPREDEVIVCRDDAGGKAFRVQQSAFTINYMFGLWDSMDNIPPHMAANLRTNADRTVGFVSRTHSGDDVRTMMGDVLWTEVSKLTRKVCIADLARYYLMWVKGGLYLDMDVLAKQNPIPLIRSAIADDVEALLFTEHDACPTAMLGARENPEHTKRIYNCMFWSRPNHPMWKDCFDTALDRCRALNAEGSVWTDTDVIWATGPDVVTTVWAERYAHHPEIRVLSNQDTLRYFVHTHTGTWRNRRDVV